MLGKRWKVSVALLMMLALAWPSLSASAQTPGSTTVYINGQPITTTAINQNGYQLVPASFFRQMNVSVEWSTRYRAAVLRNGSVEIGFPVGERHTDYRWITRETWSRDNVDTRTTLIGGVSYVPLSYTANKLGFNVQYDAKARAAKISTGSMTALAQPKQTKPTSEEMYWLYQITEAEAGGESFNGKVAVAAAILNRVADPEWPQTIIDTIFQVEVYNGKSYYQFSPVLDKRIYNVKPSKETKRAVEAAVNGSDPSLGAVVFYNPGKTDNAWVRSRPVTTKIGNHVFAK